MNPARKELQYFLEGIACDVARFHHVKHDGLRADEVRIRQEVPLGTAGWADIRVDLPSGVHYFIEVKVRHQPEEILEHLVRKYTADAEAVRDASRLVVLVEEGARGGGLEEALQSALPAHLGIELWSDSTVFAALHELFGAQISSFDEGDLVDAQAAIDRAKGQYAFGEDFSNTPLQSSLLWHFSFWKLKALLAQQHSERSVVEPGLYRDVITVFADLSAFSSYVRDTRDDRIVRDALTSFYSKSRYQVLNNGGMIYQFLGDGVVALFGVPVADENYVSEALACARALLTIGDSVSHDWQRQIDQVQSVGGAHVGVAIGDLNIVPLRPFSRAHLGAIADSINTAARISAHAGSGEIVATNAFYQRVPRAMRDQFELMKPVEARNIGKLQTWRTGLA